MKDIVFKTIMLKGEKGGTIASIEKTSSALNVDTYTITLNDGTTTTFQVTNGTSIASIEKTATSGYQDTYTITLTDGSSYDFQVMNGEDGAGYEVPAGSIIYFDSSDPVPEGYEAGSQPPIQMNLTNLCYGEINAGDGYAQVISRLETELSSMSNNSIRIYAFNGSYDGTIFAGGAKQFAILYRNQSGTYQVSLPCGFIDGYYYDNAWHWRKCTSEVITP